MTARYWIAQYIRDVFRNEPRNVGIIVQLGDEMAGRFLGETSPGNVDRRSLRDWSYPGVYCQWVRYWRKEISKSSIATILEANGSNYRVVEGGYVTDIGNDKTEDVMSYLFALLVSRGGFSEALQQDREQPDRVKLELEVTLELEKMNLLAPTDEPIHSFLIQRNKPVIGKSNLAHKPTFVQENGYLYVMETIDFTSYQKKRTSDRAGLAAFVFQDIRSLTESTHAIALIRLEVADMKHEDVRYGLGLLTASDAEVINWLESSNRERFLDERKRVASTTIAL